MKHAINITVHIHAQKNYLDETTFTAFLTNMSEYGYIHVGTVEQEVEFEVPDDFNFTAEEIKALQAQKKSVQAEANRKIVRIEERIQSLLCIEHKAAA